MQNNEDKFYVIKKILFGVEIILFVGILAFAFLCLLMLIF